MGASPPCAPLRRIRAACGEHPAPPSLRYRFGNGGRGPRGRKGPTPAACLGADAPSAAVVCGRFANPRPPPRLRKLRSGRGARVGWPPVGPVLIGAARPPPWVARSGLVLPGARRSRPRGCKPVLRAPCGSPRAALAVVIGGPGLLPRGPSGSGGRKLPASGAAVGRACVLPPGARFCAPRPLRAPASLAAGAARKLLPNSPSVPSPRWGRGETWGLRPPLRRGRGLRIDTDSVDCSSPLSAFPGPASPVQPGMGQQRNYLYARTLRGRNRC